MALPVARELGGPGRALLLAGTLLLALTLAAGARAAGAAEKPAGRVIMILVDGCRADAFDRLLDEGRLPAIERHLVQRGLRAKDCVTVFPSTTGPTYAPFITGLLPERSGIPGIRWYDRTTGRSTVYAGREFGRINQDLSPDHPTLYELLPGKTVSVFGMVDRGSARSLMPLLEMGVPKLRGQYLQMDAEIQRTFMAEVFEGGEIPRFIFVSFHAPDSVGHSHGVEHPDYVAGIAQVDAFVEEMAMALRHRGEYDSTYWVLSADHGQTSATQRMSLAEYLSGTHGLKVRDSIGRETAPHNLRAGKHRESFDVHVEVSGNACVQFYLCPEGADPSERVPADEVRRFRSRSGREVNLEAALLKAPAVELVLSREEPGRYRVASQAGAAEITRSDGRFEYRVVEGEDPLGYSRDAEAARLIRGAGGTGDEWFAATASSRFPDGPLQIAQLLESPRAGDVIVTARNGWEPWTEGQAGVHGGLCREHMRVPLLMAGPDVRFGELARARTVDVFPTLTEMLGLPAPAGIDGAPLPWRAGPVQAGAAEPISPASGGGPGGAGPIPVFQAYLDAQAALEALEGPVAAGEPEAVEEHRRLGRQSHAMAQQIADQVAASSAAGEPGSLEELLGFASQNARRWIQSREVLEALASRLEAGPDRDGVMAVLEGQVFSDRLESLVGEYGELLLLLGRADGAAEHGMLFTNPDAFPSYFPNLQAAGRLEELFLRLVPSLVAGGHDDGVVLLEALGERLPRRDRLDELLGAIRKAAARASTFETLQGR